MMELVIVGNEVEVTLFDVFTDHSFLTQFQVIEEHKEVNHAANN